MASQKYLLPGNNGKSYTYFTNILTPLLEATLDMPAARIVKTLDNTLSLISLLGKIRVMGNTSFDSYSFTLIQAALYLHQFSIDPPKIPMDAVTHHGTPDYPWDSLGSSMLAP